MLGGLRYTFVPQSSPVAQFNDTGGLTIEGVVIDDPDIRDDRTQFRLRVERLLRGADELNSDGLVLVQVPRSTEVQYGDRIQATGLLITPGEFDAFSYSDYLARRGVFSIMENTAVEVLSSGHGSPFYRALFDLRSRVKDAIGRNLPEPQAGLLTGILLGNERGISPELDEDFAAVGASHISRSSQCRACCHCCLHHLCGGKCCCCACRRDEWCVDYGAGSQTKDICSGITGVCGVGDVHT